MEKIIYNTLYHFEEDGEEGFDLYEVMLLEKIDLERVSKLIDLLQNDDRYIVYQASLILISWNIEDGFKKFLQFYNERWDKSEEFEPHRIYGEDNVYDTFAKSMKISLFNNNSTVNLLPYVKILLSLYNECFFEGNLKDLLLTQDYFKIILEDIEVALDNSLEEKRYYQASQLFPVIVTYDKSNFEKYNIIFKNLLKENNKILYNLEEASQIFARI